MFSTNTLSRRYGALFALTLLSGCATVQDKAKPDPRDPWMAYNRAMYSFNDRVDRGFAKPLAKGYRAVTPKPVRSGVENFLSNLTYPGTIVNAALQGKLAQSGRDSLRFVLNSTLGIGGIFDPASAAGLEANDEDFGQTLGKWGVPSGPYLVLPLLGPSTARDAFGTVLDRATDPGNYVDETGVSAGLNVMQLVDRRARLLELDRTLSGTYDPYAFVRNAWLQRREFLVRDGNVDEAPPEDEPDSDDSGETEGEEGADAPAPDSARPN
jgi:phospholipid-binding lipoprotein MlaA